MEKEERVLGYYVLCNKLKDLIRKGWINWNVDKERVESVAEHIYSTQQLAIIMQKTYYYNIDLEKVIMMLAVHELEETIIGDLTQFEISKEEKNKIGHEAVEKITNLFGLNEPVQNLILEFDERKTDEAKFAYMCDKLECDLQCKLYDEENRVDLTREDNKALDNERVSKLLNEGKSWSEMWLEYGRDHYTYDKNFRSISEYAEKNNLHNLTKKLSKINKSK